MYAALMGNSCECKRPLRLLTNVKGKTDDTRVYTFDERSGTYSLYKISDTDEDDGVWGWRIMTQSWKPVYNMPDFNAVGIFRTRGQDRNQRHPTYLPMSEIKGKVIMIGDLAVTIPHIILEEAT